MSIDESVLCLSQTDFDTLSIQPGFTPSVAALQALLSRPVPTFIPRSECEGNPRWKQVIPYIVFLCETGPSPLVFTYWRTSSGGEGRLHGRRSLGIGGHVNLDDLRVVPVGSDPRTPAAVPIGWCAMLAGASREIGEELTITGTVPTIDPVGLIYDDSEAVNRDHLGVLMIARIAHTNMDIRDPDCERGMFHQFDAIRSHIDEFETWSRIVIGGTTPMPLDAPSSSG